MTKGHITPAGKSVLDALDLDPAFVVKAKLAIRIQRTIEELGLTQRQAAALLPVTQPKLSLITRGRLDDISQPKLEECLQALGHDIEIRVGPRHEGAGRLRVLETAAD
jgi:predicted XRE-type DNA-binding protein